MTSDVRAPMVVSLANVYSVLASAVSDECPTRNGPVVPQDRRPLSAMFSGPEHCRSATPLVRPPIGYLHCAALSKILRERSLTEVSATDRMVIMNQSDS